MGLSNRSERHRRADRGRLERGSLVDQEGFHGLAEILDEMKAVDNLHRLGCPLANAVGVQVTAVATDHGNRRMLG